MVDESYKGIFSIKIQLAESAKKTNHIRREYKMTKY